MKQTNAPQLTPSPSIKKQSRAVAADSSPSSTFLSMVLDMTWRLAIVVLVPVIGGVELDNHLKTHQLYLIIGLVVALVLVIAVVNRSYQEANELTRDQAKDTKHAK